MLYQDFVKCLITGSWQLRGHTYHFLSPALQKYGYFTVDGVSDSQLNFEVAYENGDLYLYLNVDRESVPGERYRVLGNYCEQQITMVHEILKSDESGYEEPSEVVFEKVTATVAAETRKPVDGLLSRLRGLWKRSDSIFARPVKTA